MDETQPAPTVVTKLQLAAILPKAPPWVLDPLNLALLQADCVTPKRIAMFLAQTAHESNSFRAMEEYASGKAYEGRKDLGNVSPGDGTRYKGRGAIQLTGRFNYKAFGTHMGVDFLATPELVATPQYAFRAAAWYWKQKSLNVLVDKNDIEGVTRKINGRMMLGLEQRKGIYERALRILLAVNA